MREPENGHANGAEGRTIKGAIALAGASRQDAGRPSIPV